MKAQGRSSCRIPNVNCQGKNDWMGEILNTFLLSRHYNNALFSTHLLFPVPDLSIGQTEQHSFPNSSAKYLKNTWNRWILLISRSEQAPGNEFHPCDKSDKKYSLFLGPSWCNKKVNPETYVPCGSYELLVSNVAHQMKEILMIQNILFS